jgi:hypothetical protein
MWCRCSKSQIARSTGSGIVVHFHVCVVDSVFGEVAGGTDLPSAPSSGMSKVASGLDSR